MPLKCDGLLENLAVVALKYNLSYAEHCSNEDLDQTDLCLTECKYEDRQ